MKLDKKDKDKKKENLKFTINLLERFINFNKVDQLKIINEFKKELKKCEWRYVKFFGIS
mgnify:CR=1 FL=1